MTTEQIVYLSKTNLLDEIADNLKNSFSGYASFDSEWRPIVRDIDSDGDFDIIASLGGGSYEDIYMIENIGNASEASYSIPISYNSKFGPIPSGYGADFRDLDSDGDLDAIIAIQEPYPINTLKIGSYENIGTSKPRYALFEDQLLSISDFRGYGLADLDGDDDLDIYYRDATFQRVEYVENKGTVKEPNFDDQSIKTIGTPNSSHAYWYKFIDLNFDGLLDFTSYAYTANKLSVSINTGTKENPLYESAGSLIDNPDSPKLIGIQEEGIWAVELADTDDDSDLDYIVARYDSNSGTPKLEHYKNITPKDNGDAVFSISGTTQVGQLLSITESTPDPDGSGALSYIWQSSTDERTWTEIGASSTYTLTSAESGKKIRTILSYTDGQGFSESVITSTVDLDGVAPTITNAQATAQNDYKVIRENTTKVHTFEANETVTWSLSGGADLSKFSIDTSSGSLTFSSAPDYESPGDTDSNNVYVVKIRATDSAGNTADHTLTTYIDNSDELDVSSHQSGTSYSLEYICDYDGNLHANTGSVSDATKNAYKYQGLLDVNADGTKEAIYTNRESGRWVTASVDSVTGEIDYSNHGSGGTTRIVGIYIDPLVTSGEVEQFGPHDSQRRFQNDLEIDNLIAKTSGDYDGDGFQEVYWKTNDGTAYLRALMHADGNIQYANYQSEAQMTAYLTENGHSSVVSEVV